MSKGKAWLTHGAGSSLKQTVEALLEGVFRDKPDSFSPYAVQYLRNAFPAEASVASSTDLGGYKKREDVSSSQVELVRYIQDIKANATLESLTFHAMMTQPENWVVFAINFLCGEIDLTDGSTLPPSNAEKPKLSASEDEKRQLFELIVEGDADGLLEMMKQGVSPNYVDPESNSLLMKAAEGESRCVEVILGREGDALINYQNRDGFTALMNAAAHDAKDCAALLLAHGADASIQNNAGLTALQIAEKENALEVIAVLDPARVGEPEPLPKPKRTGRRGSISSESYDPSKVAKSRIPFIPKSEEQKKAIRSMIADNMLFKSLDRKLFDTVVDALASKQVRAGEKVIEQGQQGDFYYVVESGEFECFVQSEGTTPPGKLVMTYGVGSAFGELALMYNAPRAATVVCTKDASLWAVDRETFRSLMQQMMVQKRSRLEGLLKTVPLLKSLGAYEISGLADACEDVYFKSGDIVFREKDVGYHLYILLDGAAIATQVNAAGEKVVVMEYGHGDYFGEMAVLGKMAGQRQATIEVTSEEGHCVSISGTAFDRLLGQFRSQMMERAENYSPHV